MAGAPSNVRPESADARREPSFTQCCPHLPTCLKQICRIVCLMTCSLDSGYRLWCPVNEWWHRARSDAKYLCHFVPLVKKG